MNFDTCLRFENCHVAGRTPGRTGGGVHLPVVPCSDAAEAARRPAAERPRPRVQRGPGWVALDSIALSRFR